VNLALICLDVSTVKMTIKLTQMNACSGDTVSTKNSMLKNMSNSEKPGEIQLVQL